MTTKKNCSSSSSHGTFKFRCVCVFCCHYYWIYSAENANGSEVKRSEERRRKTENLLFKFTLSIYRNLRKKYPKIRTNAFIIPAIVFIFVIVVIVVEGPHSLTCISCCTYWHWRIQPYCTTVNCEHHSNASQWSSNLLFVFHFLLSRSLSLLVNIHVFLTKKRLKRNLCWFFLVCCQKCNSKIT